MAALSLNEGPKKELKADAPDERHQSLVAVEPVLYQHRHETHRYMLTLTETDGRQDHVCWRKMAVWHRGSSLRIVEAVYECRRKAGHARSVAVLFCVKRA